MGSKVLSDAQYAVVGGVSLMSNKTVDIGGLGVRKESDDGCNEG